MYNDPRSNPQYEQCGTGSINAKQVAMRAPEIPAEIDRLIKSVDCLTERINALSGKLIPACCAPRAEPDRPSQSSPPFASVLGSTLAANRSRIEGMAEHIDWLCDHLEI